MSVLKTFSLLLLLGIAFVAGFFAGKSGYFEPAVAPITVIDEADRSPAPENAGRSPESEETPMPDKSEDDESFVGELTPGEKLDPPIEFEMPSEAVMAARAEQKFVTLSDKDGRELNGEILEMTDDALKVRRYVDFRIVEVPVALLSPVDQAFIAYKREHRAADAPGMGEGNSSREERLLARSAQAQSSSGGDVIDYSKYGRKGANARKRWRTQFPEKHYDPNTIVYCDALWMRVHAADSPALILKDLKKTMTLEQADKEGWRIGESGQSGRTRSSFQGYRRQYPEKPISEDALGVGRVMKSGKYKWCLAGCHRATIQHDWDVLSMKEAMEKPRAYVCQHCIERGPSVTSVDPVRLKQMSPDGPAAVPYENPLAVLEEFMGRRFFFDYSGHYKTYRATGDKSALESLLKSARYYHSLCERYPSVAQAKATDPEHWNYLFPMAGWSRITLQEARKYPGQVSQEAIAEAEAILDATVAALKPVCEGDSNLDPEMGIPAGLANDFRKRAYNRAANGIGTLAVASAALEDLQAIKKTQAYQPTIDRYRKSVEGWVRNWENMGCMYTEADGKTYFYYAYAGTGRKREDGLMLGAADDQGHYAHCVMGATLIYESTPELGVDEDFMIAIANAITHNSTTRNGSIQCPSADAIQPQNRKPFGIPRGKLFIYEAFRDGLILAQHRLKDNPRAAAAQYTRSGDKIWDYFEALRKDRTLIHLGEKM